MAVYCYKSLKSSRANEIDIESDIPLPYTLSIPFIGSHLLISEKEQTLARVRGTYINILGQDLVIRELNNSKWGWAINKTELLIPNGQDYLLGNEVVASVINELSIATWLKNLVKNRELVSFDPELIFEFNEDRLDPLLALCIFAVEISHSLDN